MMNVILVLSILVLSHTAALESQSDQNEQMIKMHIENLTDCQFCGLSFEKPFKLPIIINGINVASAVKYPWMVSLVDADSDYSDAFCGGAILNKDLILTAAHCVWQFIVGSCNFAGKRCKPSQPFWVKFFTPEWYNGVQPLVQADSIIVHPQFFHEAGKAHDIALVKLTRPIKCNTFANPICLPPSTVVLKHGHLVRFAGYGKDHPHDNKTSSFLDEGSLMVTKKKKCMAMGFVRKDMQCIYCLEGYKNHTICYGDSGGSMFNRLYKKGGFVTLGVASLQSSMMCNPNATVVYTSVVHNLPWITKMLADDPKNDGYEIKETN